MNQALPRKQGASKQGNANLRVSKMVPRRYLDASPDCSTTLCYGILRKMEFAWKLEEEKEDER
jgi:hypothetical protein